MMTDKLAPEALILIDFEFTDVEIDRLRTAAAAPLSEEDINKLAVAFGKYLAGTLLFCHSSSPKQVGRALVKTKDALNNALEFFEEFLCVDGVDALILSSLNLLPSEFSRLPNEVKRTFGVEYMPSDVESKKDTDLYLVARNLIDFQISISEEDPFSVADIYKILKITLDNVESVEAEISGSGGRIGDPYFTSFITDLLDVICPFAKGGEYNENTVNFIDESRQIIAHRLGERGEKKAQQTVKQLDKANLVSRIRDARAEVAKTNRGTR